MFFEEIPTLTRDHCRSHLRDYLDQINAQFPEDTLTLVLPKTFEVSSLVGGVAGIAGRETLPALAISAGSKQVDQGINEDLYNYLYQGQIMGMVSADNSAGAEKIAWRYAAALELFIREHQFTPYADAIDPNSLPFLITEFGFMRTQPMGAAAVQDEAGKVKLWIDGFRIEVFWRVSENGPGQHG